MDAIIQIPPDSTGKKLDTEQVTVGANDVQRQRVQLAGALADAIAAVLTDAPADNTPALCVRLVGGTIMVNTLAAVLAAGNDADGKQISNLRILTMSNPADAGIITIKPLDYATLSVEGARLANVSVPLDAADAATKDYVDTRPFPQLNNILDEGNDAGGKAITNLADPTDDQDAATKASVAAATAALAAAPVADAIDLTDIVTQFNALLAAMRAAATLST